MKRVRRIVRQKMRAFERSTRGLRSHLSTLRVLFILEATGLCGALVFALTRGRFVLFDVYARERTRQTISVETVARADLSREAWRPLESACADFERVVLPADPAVFGGELYVASGTRT